jgi:hypothetical protein
MVVRCELRWQMPRVASEKYGAAVRALYVELTGDEGRVSLAAMAEALRIGGDDEPVAVHRRLAERRVGGGEGGGGVYERFMQLQLDESERAAREGDELGAKFTLSGCEAEHALYRSTR